MLIYLSMTIYLCVKLLVLLLPKMFEYIVLDIYLGGDVHFIIIGIYSAQSETSAALQEIAKLMPSHVSYSQCIVGDLHLDWLCNISAKV